MLSKHWLVPMMLLATLTTQENGCPPAEEEEPGTPTATPTATPAPTPLDDDLGMACDVSFPRLAAGPAPSRSFFSLPTSNGYVAANYAISLDNVPVKYADGSSGVFNPRHKLISFTDHVPAQMSASSYTKDLLYDFYFGVRVDGVATWLSEVAETEATYEPGTGMVRLVQKVGDIAVTTWLFAPFHGESFSLVAAAQATNQGSVAHKVELFSLQNVHAGGEGSAKGETTSASGSYGILESQAYRLYYRALETPLHRSAAPAGDAANPWMVVNNGGNLPDRYVSGNDVAAGFQWSLGGGSLAAGASGWGGLVLAYNGNGESDSGLVSRVDGFVAGRNASQVVSAEKDFWTQFHALEPVSPGRDAAENAVYRQSTAVLKMSQVREAGKGQGQLLASLPPGIWNRSWVRDASYATVALTHSGHLAEARDSLKFMINADAGYYASSLNLTDYLVSVCRYLGNGMEESDGASCPDGSDAGPNIELDDFGLFLWAYADYLTLSKDSSFQTATLSTVLSGVADPLVSLIDPAYNLLAKDSSIWERHIKDCFPNGAKHFSYSSLQAVNGLRGISGITGDSRYAEAAQVLRGGLLDTTGGPVLVTSLSGQQCPVLASAPEEICSYCGPYDGSVIEAVNQGVYHPGSALAMGTLRALMDNLGMGNGSPGFLRGDDGTGTSNQYPWYDDQEWVVVDLWMAQAMARTGSVLGDAILLGNANTLLDWVTAQAQANANLIPELLSDGVYTADDNADWTHIGYDPGHDFQGAVPMGGFGAGAWILTLETLTRY